jgi:hypothetical protein
MCRVHFDVSLQLSFVEEQNHSRDSGESNETQLGLRHHAGPHPARPQSADVIESDGATCKF